MCSMVITARPPTSPEYPNRWALTVPASIRPAATSRPAAVVATRRS